MSISKNWAGLGWAGLGGAGRDWARFHNHNQGLTHSLTALTFAKILINRSCFCSYKFVVQLMFINIHR